MKLQHRQFAKPVAVVLAFAVVGIGLITISRAALLTATSEAESGVLSGKAALSTDPTASGNTVVAFGRDTQVTYDTPLTISASGTYSGSWESTDANTAAVTISTNQPVIIDGCNIRSKGPLIAVTTNNADITVRHCKALGLNPNVNGQQAGRFLKAEKIKHLVVEHNTLEATSGIYLNGYGGAAAGDNIQIRYNKVSNIDGRVSDGANGYTSDGFPYVQFVQFDSLSNLPASEIAWNEVINQPAVSRPEDNINIYLSGGQASSPLQIHDNYVQGAYPTDPVTQDFSGGGIIVDGEPNSAAYIKIFNNQVVSTTNYGVAIAAGHDNEAYNNRVVSSGLLADGRKIKAQNIGVYVWNINGGSGFTNNSAHDNTIGWWNANSNERNDSWFPDCNPTAACSNNQSLKAGTIALSDEAAELTLWHTKLTNGGLTVGN